VVTIRRGAQTEQKTIALNKLPTGQPLNRGANFRLLFKKDEAAPNNPRIVRFQKVAPPK
jgi:hypothetical protein